MSEVNDEKRISDDSSSSGSSSSENKSFIEEVVKTRKKGITYAVNRIVKLALYGMVFGVFASIGFSALKPVIGLMFKEKPAVVSLPDVSENNEGEIVSDPQENEDEQDQESESTDKKEIPLTKESYDELVKSMYEVSSKAYRCIVSVEPYSEEDETAASTVENAVKTMIGQNTQMVTGVLVADNGRELLIMTDGMACENADQWNVAFSDGSRHKAFLKKWDKNTNIAILSVNKSKLSKQTSDFISMAKIGNSDAVRQGDFVIALGSTFGYADGTGYGIISSVDHKEIFYDKECKVLSTDISSIKGETGMLFNNKGQLIGMIGGSLWKDKDVATANALSISGLHKIMERLLNGYEIPYTGVYGTEVTKEIGEELGIPYGIYVMKVDADSPAMSAGIQSGDIIQKFDGEAVTNMVNYDLALSQKKVSQQAEVELKRLGADGYVDIKTALIVGEKK